MDLAANPFHTLGATMEDDRRRIAELAEEQSLVGDESSIREARSVLTNPRKRLAAEVGWLPGLGTERIVEAISMLDVNPAGVRRIIDVSALARANLLAEGLVRPNASSVAGHIAAWILDLAQTHEQVEVEEVIDLLNTARSAAGFAAITNPENVEEALQRRRRHFLDAIKRCLDQLPPVSLVDTVTLAVDGATSHGEVHAPRLIDDMVHTYEVEAQEFFDKETRNVKTLVHEIRDTASESVDEERIDELVTKLERVVKNWDYVAQPIQVSYSSQGLSHGLSHEVAREIRELAVGLYNEHALLEVSQRLTEIQRSVFAEIAKITEQLDDDAARLNEIAEERAEHYERMKEQAEAWVDEITYEANVGMMKNKLAISPAGVQWKGSTIGLDEITRVRWSGTKHYTNGIPSNAKFSITVGAQRTFVRIELKDYRVFAEFVERLSKTAGMRLFTEILKGLRAGQQYRFGTAVVGDYGIVLERPRVFGANEEVFCKWTELALGNGEGTFWIAKKDETKVAVELPYDEIDNVHVLEAAMRTFWRRASARMSELLELT